MPHREDPADWEPRDQRLVDDGRAISPVVGTVLMVALTLLLASVVTAGLVGVGDGLGDRAAEFERTVEATGTATGNPWIGSLGGLIQPADDDAGASDVRYRIHFDIDAGDPTVGNSLNSVEVRVVTGSTSMFAGTSQADLEKVTIDTDEDGAGDQDITADVNGWTVSDGGATLKIGFGGSAYTAQPDDSVIVIVDGVDNPTSPGTYDVEAQTSGDGNWQTGQIDID